MIINEKLIHDGVLSVLDELGSDLDLTKNLIIPISLFLQQRIMIDLSGLLKKLLK